MGFSVPLWWYWRLFFAIFSEILGFVKLPSVKNYVVYFLTIFFPRKEFKVFQEFDVMGMANIMPHHIS